MIKQEEIVINNRNFIKTISDEGYYITKGQYCKYLDLDENEEEIEKEKEVLYEDAIELPDKVSSWKETNTKIPTETVEINEEAEFSEAFNILMEGE